MTDHVLPIDLECHAISDNEDELVSALRKVKGERGSRRKRAEQVARIMEQTQSRRVRNTAALALADMRYEQAGERIWRLLERPGIGFEAGTLLYALEELGSKVPLAILVRLLQEASYEARQGIILLLEAGKVELGTSDDQRSALEKLTVMRDAADDELSAAADIAMQYLATLPLSI